jgi:transposase InsO family protein
VKKSHTKADTIWSADIVRSGGSTELLIFDEKSGRAIVRAPVAVTDVTTVTEALKKALQTVGPPFEIRTDAGLFFTSNAVRALLTSLGVTHTFAGVGAKKNRAERRARF